MLNRYFPRGVWNILFDYSDINIAAAVVITVEGSSLLQQYTGTKTASTIMSGIALLPKIIEFREVLMDAVSKEVELRNEKEQKRPIRKSTLGRIATTLGLAASAVAPYIVFDIAANRISAHNHALDMRDSLLSQLKSKCNYAFDHLSYKDTTSDCTSSYSPVSGMFSLCTCTYRNIQEDCIVPNDCLYPCYPGICHDIVKSISQCNTTIYSNFLSECNSVNDTNYGGWIIVGGVALSLTLIGLSLYPYYKSASLDYVSRNSIKIDDAFMQKYFADNDFFEFIFKNFVMNNTKNKSINPSKGIAMLNQAINEFTLEKRHLEDSHPQSQLHCLFFKKTSKTVDVVIEVKHDASDNQSLTVPLLR